MRRMAPRVFMLDRVADSCYPRPDSCQNDLVGWKGKLLVATNERVITFSAYASLGPDNSFASLDRRVNEWLKEHPSAVIRHRLSAGGASANGAFLAITVFYAEPQAEALSPPFAEMDGMTIPLPDLSMARATRRLEEELLRRALARAQGDHRAAAQLLEISLERFKHSLQEFMIA